jgi:hypothetical protein
VFHAGVEALGFPGNWIASAIEYHAVKAWLEQSDNTEHTDSTLLPQGH